MPENTFVASGSSYSCAKCCRLNDAAIAPWCSDVSKQRTFVCGACGACFCSAPLAWRRSFFLSAAGATYRERLQREQIVSRRLTAVTSDHARPVVMIVDDDKVVHLIAQRVLEDLAGTIVHAYDGDEALRLCREMRPDLVITDALLPKVDGRNLARMLKTTPETSQCKVIVITGLYKGIRYRLEALRDFRVDEYLEKPVPPARLHAVAASLLDLQVNVAPVVPMQQRAEAVS